MPEAAQPTDLPDILELLEELNLDMDDINYARFLVVRHKGEIVAAGRIKEHEEGTLELCSLGVTPEQRGKGLGRELIADLIKRAGMKPLWLVTEIPGYFTQFGFEAVPDSEIPPELCDKVEKCLTELDCSKPVVMRIN